jgi:6-phosphofructokinase 1
MNAAIRAVVRTGVAKGWEVFGVRHGFSGLISGSFVPMGPRDVSGIIQLGGTILGSARSLEFKTDEGRSKAIRALHQQRIEALIVIGGNGSQQGAHALHEAGFPVVGVASTIDNDLHGSEITIGVDTALNIALEAIDRLKIGIAGGAEAVVIPEVKTDPDLVAADLRDAYERGKSHAVIVVAEGDEYNAESLARHFAEHQDRLGFDLRVTTLGHVQRGGNPGAFDRLLATRLAAAATERLADGDTGVLMGLLKGDIVGTPLDEVVSNVKTLEPHLLELAEVLAR